MTRRMVDARSSSCRKSVLLELEIEPSTPSLKRKFDRLENCNSPDTVRRFVRGKETPSPWPSSCSQKSAEHRTPVSGRLKQRSLSSLIMKSEKVELNMEEVIGLKRKNMTGRSFKSIFRKQRVPQADRADNASDEVLRRTVGNLECNNASVVSSIRGVVVEPGSKSHHTRSSVNNESRGLAPNPSSRNESTVGNTMKDVIMPGSGPSASSSDRCEHPDEFGTCVICCKQRRVSYDSPEQELCSCCPTVNNHPGGFRPCKPPGETHGDEQILCSMCNKDDQLLSCSGRGCKTSYHYYCLDPLIANAIPSVWHCSECVKKKLLFGVHSVSDGVESIWDVREVELSNAKGVRQKQYLVKYSGLAHVHNQWLLERQLLSEDLSLISSFREKSQFVRWNKEWTLPQRLLKKRPIQEKVFIASPTDISVCKHEWLVKWHGLNYDHCTWELENESFLSSSLGQKLMNEYEDLYKRPIIDESHQREPTVKLPRLQPSHFPVSYNHLLKYVSKLHGCVLEGQNAVVFDHQDKVATIIFLIKSMRESCRPFLVVTASSSVSLWNAEFLRLAPSLDVAVSVQNKEPDGETRAPKFSEGHTFHVLLSSTESVFEDFEILKHAEWEAVIIDDYPYSGMLGILSQVKMLAEDSVIILLCGQIKETTTECLKILSLVESPSEFEKLIALQLETNDNLYQLKDRLSQFIAYDSTCSTPKFLEHWVPVHMSNYQLELYCETLLSNRTVLCSSSRHDSVGAFRNILASARKCCDHPYLLKPSLQQNLIDEKGLEKLLDVGIEISGKLQHFDKMLGEIKTRGLVALVLFQSIVGSQGASIGDILDDFLRQRFGPNTYERVDARILLAKKQAAVNKFNKKESGQFVFLLENRACTSAIKFSALDVIIIFDSDWNPANDLARLQRMTIDAKVEQIKVFRLYTSFTLEERALVLSKEGLNIDTNLHNLSRCAIDTLLSWGSAHLFQKLDEYHHDRNSSSVSDVSSEQSLSLLNKVRKEFEAILSDDIQAVDSNSVISQVKLGDSSYTSAIPTTGELIVQLSEGEEGHVFWKQLLDGKSPQWKHLKEEHPLRTRKRLQGSVPSFSDTNNEKDSTRKRKKVVDENVDPTIQVRLGYPPVTPRVISTGVEAESSEQSGGDHVSSENVDKSTSLNGSGFKKLKEESIEDLATEKPTGNQILAPEAEVDGTDANNEIEKSKKKSERLIMKLTRKHREEIQEFCQIWETKTLKLEGDHKLEISCVRLMHGRGTMGIGKLKLLENGFVSRMEEHNRLKALQLKELKAKQLAEIEDASARRTGEAQSGTPEYSSRSEDDVGLQLSTSSGNVETGDAGLVPRSAQSPSKNSGAQMDDAQDCEAPIGKAASDDSNGDIGFSTVDDHRNQFKSSSDNNESNVSANVAAPNESPDESIRDDRNEEVTGDEGCNVSSPEGLASQRDDEPDKGGLQNSEQTLHSGLNLPVLEDVDVSGAETDNNAAALPEESVAVMHEPNEAANGRLNGDCFESSFSPASGEVRNASLNTEPPEATGGEPRILESSSVSKSAAPQISFPPAVIFDGSHFPSMLAHQYNAPSMSADPLQNELERLKQTTAVLEKNHENTISTLRSECEKEISQIRDKYAVKLRESETEYRSKRDEQERNLRKVVMSKLLADAFRSKLVFRPYGNFIPAGIPYTSFTQHPPPNPVSSSQSFSGTMFPGVLAASRPQAAANDPSRQILQQQQQQLNMRCSFVPQNQTANPPTAPRPPPVIGAISPGSYHPRTGGEIRMRAPHLQPTTTRPPPPSSVTMSGFQLQQQQQNPLHYLQRISNAATGVMSSRGGGGDGGLLGDIANREMPRVENDGVVCLSDEE